MSRPDHLLDRDVESSTVTVRTSPKGRALGTKKSGYDRYAIKLLKSNAKLRSSVVTGPLPERAYQWTCPATILY